MKRWVLISLALAGLAGCSPDYPMDKPGTWSLDKFGSSNDANLRAMVADPEDLVHGRGDDTAMGVAAAHPVAALDAGKRAPLPQTNSLSVDLGNSDSSAGSGSGSGNGSQ